MGLKKRHKQNAEFNMSSLTDIIFLLLIFFMLTSTLVRIQNFEIPESDVKTVAPTSITVELRKSGEYALNGQEIQFRKLESGLRAAVKDADNQQDLTVTIVAEMGVSFDRVIKVMEMANKMKAKAILATQPKSS